MGDVAGWRLINFETVVWLRFYATAAPYLCPSHAVVARQRQSPAFRRVGAAGPVLISRPFPDQLVGKREALAAIVRLGGAGVNGG